MTPAEKARAALERCEKMTPGEWCTDILQSHPAIYPVGPDQPMDSLGLKQAIADCHAIAALPDLIAATRELLAENERLRELSDAVTKGPKGMREFYMSIPAEPERDADLVLAAAADELERQAAEIERLRDLIPGVLTAEAQGMGLYDRPGQADEPPNTQDHRHSARRNDEQEN